MEKELLALLGERSAYFKYQKHIKESQLLRETAQIVRDLRKYYSEDDERTTLDWNEFSQWFLLVAHPMYGQDEGAKYRAIFDTMASCEPDERLQEQIVEAFLEQGFCHEIAEVAGEIAEGSERYSFADIDSLSEGFHESMGHLAEADEDDWSLSSLVEDEVQGFGYKWRLPEFNISFGPISGGPLLLWSGRPGLGKTTMLASEVTHWTEQTPDDRPTLVFANEEGSAVIRMRWIQAALGWTNEEVKANPELAERDLEKLYGMPFQERFLILHRPGGSIYDLEALCKKHNPAIIVVDQLRLCTGFEKTATEVERLKELYRRARIMGATYGPFCTVHQASDAAQGKLYPSGNMLEGCRTEVQGALDDQVMIGADDAHTDIRGLNIVKNKLPGGDPHRRETTWEVKIDPRRVRYVGGAEA